MMAPPAARDNRRPYKRLPISDQQRRREIALDAQATRRADAQARARRLASSLMSFPSPSSPETCLPLSPSPASENVDPSSLPASAMRDSELNYPAAVVEMDAMDDEREGRVRERGLPLDVASAERLKGREARQWFARQLMLPEWMADAPPHLDRDWYVSARPSGKRCFVVSSKGHTVSRLRNGSILHRFPSALPNGARIKDVSGPSNSYSILDCIFSESDQTYYVIDMLCWRDYSLYDCTAEFRFFWLGSKLTETGACNPPSTYHRYRFSIVLFHDCSLTGLQTAYYGSVPYVKDGLLFYNKHAHYQAGNTPLALVWKDINCSEYVIDTDSKGEVPSLQQVVLELQENGSLTTSDEPPIVFGSLDGDFIKQSGLLAGYLLRFSMSDQSVSIVDGRLTVADLQFLGKANRAKAFADSYSKILFQYAARHAPLRTDDLFAAIQSEHIDGTASTDIEMAD